MGRTLGLLNRYHWFVFLPGLRACLDSHDCMDQQLFNLARAKHAVAELMPFLTVDDPRIAGEAVAARLSASNPEGRPDDPPLPAQRCRTSRKVRRLRHVAVFLIGWAVGGLGFGIMGDRAGAREDAHSHHFALFDFHRPEQQFSVTVWDFKRLHAS